MRARNIGIEIKRQELVRMVECALPAVGVSVSGKRAEEIVRAFAVISPPEAHGHLALVTISAGSNPAGHSVKLGNIWLSMRKLVAFCARTSFTAKSASSVSDDWQPWFGILAGVVIWEALCSLAKIEISERDACVLWAMWSRRDASNLVEEAVVLEDANLRRRLAGLSEIAAGEFKQSLSRLESLRTVERDKTNPALWLVREGVEVRY